MPLVCSFKLKGDDTLIDLPVSYLLNNVEKENGLHEEVQAEDATISVISKKDVMKEVKIGLKGEEKPCQIEKITQPNGDVLWSSSSVVQLIGQDGIASEKEISIKITPKKEEIYKEATCTYHLTGKKDIKDSNAEFVFVENNPKIIQTTEWVNDALKENAQSYDLGVKAINVEAYTVSSKASVKYQFMMPDGNSPLEGYTEKLMQSDENGKHTARIELLENLPTIIKFFVVAEDSSTNNTKKGQCNFSYNHSALRWSYTKLTRSNQYSNTAYDSISVNTKDESYKGTLAVIFAPPKEDLGYSPKSEGFPEWQEAFTKMKRKKNIPDVFGNFQWYRTIINIEKMMEKVQNENERYVVLPMLKKIAGVPIECFTYKVKIKVQK